MKRWIVHIHYVAKATNKNFAGEVHEYYYGRGSTLLHRIDDRHLTADQLLPYFIHEYGFKNKGGAARALKTLEHTEEVWDSTYELIEMEV